MLYYFKKGKNTTEMQNKDFQSILEKVLWLMDRVKSGVKFCAGDFSLDNALQLGRLVEVDSDQIETLPLGR